MTRGSHAPYPSSGTAECVSSAIQYVTAESDLILFCVRDSQGRPGNTGGVRASNGSEIWCLNERPEESGTIPHFRVPLIVHNANRSSRLQRRTVWHWTALQRSLIVVAETRENSGEFGPARCICPEKEPFVVEGFEALPSATRPNPEAGARQREKTNCNDPRQE